MTTDELRAKFEAWYPNAIGDVQPLECYMKGYASRDAEVEALRKDAEKYRKLLDLLDEAEPARNEAPTIRNIIDDAINLGSGCLNLYLNATMREGE